MPYAERIRQRLSQLNNIEEKKMFRGIAFLVDEKMCVNVSGEEMMYRIDPAIHDTAIQKQGCRTVIMKGKELKGYVLIHQEALQTQEDFDYYIGLALEFNKKAKATKKRKK